MGLGRLPREARSCCGRERGVRRMSKQRKLQGVIREHGGA